MLMRAWKAEHASSSSHRNWSHLKVGTATIITHVERDDASVAQRAEVERCLADAAGDSGAPYSPATLYSQANGVVAHGACYRLAVSAAVGRRVELSAHGKAAFVIQGGASARVLRDLLRENNLSLTRSRVLGTFDKLVCCANGRTILLLAEYIVKEQPVAHWATYLGAAGVLVDRPGQGTLHALALPLPRPLPLRTLSSHHVLRSAGSRRDRAREQPRRSSSAQEAAGHALFLQGDRGIHRQRTRVRRRSDLRERERCRGARARPRS